MVVADRQKSALVVINIGYLIEARNHFHLSISILWMTLCASLDQPSGMPHTGSLGTVFRNTLFGSHFRFSSMRNS